MIIGLLSFASESDIEILIAMIVCLFIAVMIWWEYYARPSRDSSEPSISWTRAVAPSCCLMRSLRR